MHVLLLTLALVSRVVPGQVVHDRAAFQPMAVTISAPAEMAVTQQPPPTQTQPPPQINVEVNRGGRGWYANPVWIAIGAIALVVVVLMIVMASKGGGGTTVVRG